MVLKRSFSFQTPTNCCSNPKRSKTIDPNNNNNNNNGNGESVFSLQLNLNDHGNNMYPDSLYYSIIEKMDGYIFDAIPDEMWSMSFFQSTDPNKRTYLIEKIESYRDELTEFMKNSILTQCVPSGVLNIHIDNVKKIMSRSGYSTKRIQNWEEIYSKIPSPTRVATDINNQKAENKFNFLLRDVNSC